MQGLGPELSGLPFPELDPERSCLCFVGLTSGCLQGAYGVVRLAYNESEDRHYVSLGLGKGAAHVGPGILGSRQMCWGKGLVLPLIGEVPIPGVC